jgi:hypothetical protein
MATSYTFTQPIRYYKANDPYYYEVDNIPLRQLEENILFVKNQLEGPGGDSGNEYLTNSSELNINNIKQLRPHAIGGRTVKVNAGRFVSRVNDAFDISNPLTNLTYGQTLPSGSKLLATITQTWNETQRDAVWESFIKGSNSARYSMTGLEHTYTFYSSPGGIGTTWGTTTQVGAGKNYPVFQDGTVVWPGQSKFSLISPAVKAGQFNSGTNPTGYLYNYSNLPNIHLSFVQMWRGVFRTSVVDFPDVEIEIPAWNDDDFYYVDDNGQYQNIPATQRIDLLVAYSLPIDSSSTTIPDFQEGFEGTAPPIPKTLTSPTLGIIRGAGIGIAQGLGGNDSGSPKVISSVTTEGIHGSSRIAANVNDSNPVTGGAPTGLTDINGAKVYGSFPAPDDLLNIAPLLSLNVSPTDFQLIGQAALPLAYIVVKKDSTLVNQQDIIDIRPFLRTTEFSYNERAGIAGANPPLSLANPAVGAFQVNDALSKFDTDIANVDARVAAEEGKSNGRVVYTDYVMGGLAYGVEGTLLTMCDHSDQSEIDPWGDETAGATYTAGDGIDYKFGGQDLGGGGFAADFTSSQKYMESQDLFSKSAFLEYVYNERQDDLKRWLNDPNNSIVNSAATYLGLPSDATGRNIPLYPEWDLPLDETNYATVMNVTAPASESVASAKPTWWMWIEGMTDHRALVYAPGGVISDYKPGGTGENYLSKLFGFGYPDNQVGRGGIAITSKTIQVTLPQWANDYDVLVEYVNCGPCVSSEVDSQHGPHVGFGSGLYLNKGPINEGNTAVFTINSAAQPHPEGDKGIVKGGQIADIMNGANGGENNRKSPILNTQLFQHLSYTVCLPQFRQTKFNVGEQRDGIVQSGRFTPKFGAAFYPTVKYTIIAYEQSPMLSNNNDSGLSPGNNYTYVQTNIGQGVAGALLADAGTGTYEAQAPFSDNFSTVYIP